MAKQNFAFSIEDAYPLPHQIKNKTFAHIAEAWHHLIYLIYLLILFNEWPCKLFTLLPQFVLRHFAPPPSVSRCNFGWSISHSNFSSFPKLEEFLSRRGGRPSGTGGGGGGRLTSDRCNRHARTDNLCAWQAFYPPTPPHSPRHPSLSSSSWPPPGWVKGSDWPPALPATNEHLYTNYLKWPGPTLQKYKQKVSLLTNDWLGQLTMQCNGSPYKTERNRIITTKRLKKDGREAFSKVFTFKFSFNDISTVK